MAPVATVRWRRLSTRSTVPGAQEMTVAVVWWCAYAAATQSGHLLARRVLVAVASARIAPWRSVVRHALMARRIPIATVRCG
jgi:hypothetical protein